MMKRKFPREEALPLAKEIKEMLSPHCHKIEIAGSLRREKPLVGDIEILFIPKQGEILKPGEFLPSNGPLTDPILSQLLENGTLTKRPKSNGTLTYGENIKLLLHTKTAIPIDLFTATLQNWFNLLVVRTGGKETNIKIASQAKRAGIPWKLSGSGFYNPQTGRTISMKSEEEVFKTVGLPYLTPQERN